jgi:hypothetical protein
MKEVIMYRYPKKLKPTKNQLNISEFSGVMAKERAHCMADELNHLANVATDGGFDDIARGLFALSVSIRPTQRVPDADNLPAEEVAE